MNSSELLQSLFALREQLSESPNISPEQRQQLEQIDEQIHELITSNCTKVEKPITEQLLALEVEFSTEHPVLEKVVRDLIDKLSMMGI